MQDSQLLMIAALALAFSLTAIFAFLAIYRKVEKNPYDELLGNDFDGSAPVCNTAETASAVQAGDDMDELVAVFAAVAAYYEDSGISYNVKSVKPVKMRRNAWAMAGIADNTRPF